jgi:GntR family transcriptional regulator/MocR family aminotransferase
VSISEALRTAMQEGRLLPGSRLPSTRDFSRQLRVARGTVVLAYGQLTDEGYLRGARGAGTIVVDSLPESWLSARRAPDDGPASARPLALSRRGERLAHSPFPREILPAPHPFRPHTPAVDAFPSDLWGRLVARHARSPRPDRLRDGDARGYRPLREAIAEHLRVHRGVACSADRVVVAAGTQQLLDITGRLLLDEGDAVWMEDPGHFGARDVLRAAGARLVPVPVDSAGMDVEAGLSTAPELGDEIEIVGSSAGLEVVARLPPLVNDRAVAKLAFAAGVELLPLSRYAIRPASRGGMVLGFAAVSAARSRRAVPLLRAAVRQARRG